MRVLVTGALGHIGSRFIRAIPKAIPRSEIILLDNLHTQRYASLYQLPADTKYRFVEGDILTADFSSLLEGVDVTVHLAALTDAENSVGKASSYGRVNVDGAERVARACIQADCPLVFISTTSVYGPTSPYAESKLSAERILKTMVKERKLSLALCRFGTIFGPSVGMRFHTAVNKFCWQAANGRPVTVWRTAMDQCRPYLDLEDAVRALLFIIEKRFYDGGTYDVVTTHATVRDLLEYLISFRPEILIKTVDSPIMNQYTYRASPDAFERSGFVFKGDLKQSIGETLRWLSGFSPLPKQVLEKGSKYE
jgi:UDP-glucose 4-epimerase